MATFNEKLNDVAEKAINAALNDDMINEGKAKPGLPSKSTLLENQNIIGALIGGAAAVALELASPTGSKTSALIAGVAAAGVGYYCKDLMTIAPQNTTVSAGCAIVVGFTGMYAGRIAASYFPGNIEE